MECTVEAYGKLLKVRGEERLMAVWKEMGWDGMNMELAEKIYKRKVQTLVNLTLAGRLRARAHQRIPPSRVYLCCDPPTFRAGSRHERETHTGVVRALCVVLPGSWLLVLHACRCFLRRRPSSCLVIVTILLKSASHAQAAIFTEMKDAGQEADPLAARSDGGSR